MKVNLEEIFKVERVRDNKLSRVFGIFNEELVRIWSLNPLSKFEDIGRPSLYIDNRYQKTTLDFTFRERDTGKLFIAEMKVELAFNNYKYLTLKSEDNYDHIIHHTGSKSFAKFLEAALDNKRYEIRVNQEKVIVDGAILVWGKIDIDQKAQIKKRFNFHDILSLEEIINDLILWKDQKYFEFIDTWQNWCTSMFDSLKGT